MGNRYQQGYYRPINEHKYVGDKRNIYARSSWERKVMKWMDTNPDVIRWASEELIIPYICPFYRKRRRYFPDFVAEMKCKDGVTRKYMIEVKPKYQTVRPERGNKKQKTYVKQMVDWQINRAKWNAAIAWCEQHGMHFKILTEEDILV